MNERAPKTAKKRGGRGAASGAKQPAKRSKSRGRGRSKKVDLQKYWGDRSLLQVPDEYVTETPDASVVVESLGRPPIPGQENAAKHYLSLVYERAAALAVALAAAGRLDEMGASAVARDGGADEDDDEDDVDGNVRDPDDEDPDDQTAAR